MTATTDQYSNGLPRPDQKDAANAPERTQMAEIVSAHYRLRLAANESDVRAAQVLRFVVFNLELREGL